MKLSEHIKRLEKVLEESGDLDTVYAVDEEGNGYGEVYFAPTLGYFENGEFTSQENFKEESEFYGKEYFVNAVCIN